MRRLLVLGLVLMGLSTGGFVVPATAKTTDQSDLWWIPSESGWGIQFVEQETTIFATMFVYGPNGQPTWYTATMSKVSGALTWTGALYITSGPYFAVTPFDTNLVTVTPVGTMTLDAPLINSATLTYSVNGVTVTKQIQRQTLTTLNFTGTYSGMFSQKSSGLPCSPATDTPGTPATFIINQNGAAATIVVQSLMASCTFTGNYTQAGHFGRIAGSYTCTTGDAGTFAFFEMAVSWYDFRARTQLTSQSGCTLQGFANGLKQPPPTQ